MDALYFMDYSYDPYTELYHHGVKGQKWGYRRWQNSDGSLTAAGKEHYSKGLAGFNKKRRERGLVRINKSIGKNKKRLQKAEDRYAPIHEKESKAKTVMNSAKAKVKTTERSLDRAQNGFGSKLPGSKRRARILSKKLEKQNKKLSRKAKIYNEYHAKANTKKAKVNEIKAKLQNQSVKQRKRTEKYIKRYGQLEFNQIQFS